MSQEREPPLIQITSSSTVCTKRRHHSTLNLPPARKAIFKECKEFVETLLDNPKNKSLSQKLGSDDIDEELKQELQRASRNYLFAVHNMMVNRADGIDYHAHLAEHGLFEKANDGEKANGGTLATASQKVDHQDDDTLAILEANEAERIAAEKIANPLVTLTRSCESGVVARLDDPLLASSLREILKKKRGKKKVSRARADLLILASKKAFEKFKEVSAKMDEVDLKSRERSKKERMALKTALNNGAIIADNSAPNGKEKILPSVPNGGNE